MFLVGCVCQLRPLPFQAMKLAFDMPALLCKVSLPGRLGQVFGVEPVEAFTRGHKQPGESFDGRFAIGVQILARAGHHQSRIHGPQRCRGGFIQLVLQLPMLLAFPILQGFQLALEF